MLSEELEKYNSSISKDEGLASIRKTLTIVCIVFLAINLTGATIEEANTFLFKVKLTSHAGLSIFFLISIVYLTARYYAHAREYSSLVASFWKMRLMRDENILIHDQENDDTYGLLSKIFKFPGPGDPDVGYPKYQAHGIFRRRILFWVSNDYISYDSDKSLNTFNSKWRPQDLFKLFIYELFYQIDSLIFRRESLDLYAPYLLSATSIISFLFKKEILTILI